MEELRDDRRPEAAKLPRPGDFAGPESPDAGVDARETADFDADGHPRAAKNAAPSHVSLPFPFTRERVAAVPAVPRARRPQSAQGRGAPVGPPVQPRENPDTNAFGARNAGASPVTGSVRKRAAMFAGGARPRAGRRWEARLPSPSARRRGPRRARRVGVRRRVRGWWER